MGQPLHDKIIMSELELQAAIQALSDADWARLNLMGNKFALKRNISISDVLNEAIVAALCGRRKCPSDLPMVVFLYGVMKSLTSAALKKEDPLALAESLSPQVAEDGVDVNEVLLVDDHSPESNLIAKEALELIFKYIEDDEVAGYVLMTMCDGLSGTEACVELGISKTQYESARRKINRRLDKAKVQEA